MSSATWYVFTSLLSSILCSLFYLRALSKKWSLSVSHSKVVKIRYQSVMCAIFYYFLGSSISTKYKVLQQFFSFWSSCHCTSHLSTSVSLDIPSEEAPSIMASILLSLLDSHTKNMQIGLPTSELTLRVSDVHLQEIACHFKREAGGEAEEYLLHCAEVAQYQFCEQVSKQNQS